MDASTYHCQADQVDLKLDRGGALQQGETCCRSATKQYVNCGHQRYLIS